MKTGSDMGDIFGSGQALAAGKVKFTGGLADLIAFRSNIIAP